MQRFPKGPMNNPNSNVIAASHSVGHAALALKNSLEQTTFIEQGVIQSTIVH